MARILHIIKYYRQVFASYVEILSDYSELITGL